MPRLQLHEFMSQPWTTSPDLDLVPNARFIVSSLHCLLATAQCLSATALTIHQGRVWKGSCCACTAPCTSTAYARRFMALGLLMHLTHLIRIAGHHACRAGCIRAALEFRRPSEQRRLGQASSTILHPASHYNRDACASQGADLGLTSMIGLASQAIRELMVLVKFRTLAWPSAVTHDSKTIRCKILLPLRSWWFAAGLHPVLTSKMSPAVAETHMGYAVCWVTCR